MSYAYLFKYIIIGDTGESAYVNNYHTADHVESGQFAFTAPENVDYTACFWAPDHTPEFTISVDFEWKSGMEAKDWTNVAKKGSVDDYQAMVAQLEDQFRLRRLSIQGLLCRAIMKSCWKTHTFKCVA